MSNDDFDIIFGMFFIVFFISLFILSIVMYVLNAIGLFRLAKRENKREIAWLAWIPVGGTILMMQLLEGAVHRNLRGKLTLTYGITLAATIVLGLFFQLFGIFAILLLPLLLLAQLAVAVLFFYSFYFLAKRYSPNPVLHLVIGIVTLGFSVSISVFILRNKEVVDSTGLNLATEIEDTVTE